jgi:hypothetical protein
VQRLSAREKRLGAEAAGKPHPKLLTPNPGPNIE